MFPKSISIITIIVRRQSPFGNRHFQRIRFFIRSWTFSGILHGKHLKHIDTNLADATLQSCTLLCEWHKPISVCTFSRPALWLPLKLNGAANALSASDRYALVGRQVASEPGRPFVWSLKHSKLPVRSRSHVTIVRGSSGYQSVGERASEQTPVYNCAAKKR